MHGHAKDENEPLFEDTLMPCHMRAMFTPEETATAEIHKGFSFTKGSNIMKIEVAEDIKQFNPWHRYGDKLYDLQTDPKELHPLDDKETTLKFINAMIGLMKENEAPAEQYIRLGLPNDSDMTMEMREERISGQSKIMVPEELSKFQFTLSAAAQIRVLMTLYAEQDCDIIKSLAYFLENKGSAQIDTEAIEEFASESLDKQSISFILQILRLAARKD